MFNKKFLYQVMNDKQINDAMNVLASTKESRLFAAKRLSRWFEIDVTIKMFGKIIFQWHYPPLQSDEDINDCDKEL